LKPKALVGNLCLQGLCMMRNLCVRLSSKEARRYGFKGCVIEP